MMERAELHGKILL